MRKPKKRCETCKWWDRENQQYEKPFNQYRAKCLVVLPALPDWVVLAHEEYYRLQSPRSGRDCQYWEAA